MTVHRARVVLPSVLLVLALAACTDREKIRPHATLGARAEPLRTQFNQDVGRVRLLMIVAPT